MRLALLALAVLGCNRDDGLAAELRQRLSVLEAKVASLDKPPPAEWDDGCLTQVKDAVASARMFRTLDELVLGEGPRGNADAGGRFACISDLSRQNLPALAKAQDEAKRAGSGGPSAQGAAQGGDSGPTHVWDPDWSTRKSTNHGCWDETAKRWETDDVHRPQDSQIKCELWCRANPCSWKRKGGGRPLYVAEPKLGAQATAAGLQLGGALHCLATDVGLKGKGRGFRLMCRSLGLRAIELDLPAEAGAQGKALATLNLGDLVRVGSYGMIAATGAGPWVVGGIAASSVSIAERSSCCADPGSLATPSPPTK